MNRNERVLRLVPVWADKIGGQNAKIRLINRKIGLSTADKMVRRCYHSTPGDRVADILLEEMAKDGISLSDEIAS
jgi:hypothetical protein